MHANVVVFVLGTTSRKLVYSSRYIFSWMDVKGVGVLGKRRNEVCLYERDKIGLRNMKANRKEQIKTNNKGTNFIGGYSAKR